MSDTPNKEPVTVQKFITWNFDEATKLFLEIQEDKAKMVALQSRIVELEAKQRWIPVSERLPEEYEEVLVIFTGFNFDGGLWKKMRVCSIEDWEYIGNPTHWMPLPEPPEDFNNDPA